MAVRPVLPGEKFGCQTERGMNESDATGWLVLWDTEDFKRWEFDFDSKKTIHDNLAEAARLGVTEFMKGAWVSLSLDNGNVALTISALESEMAFKLPQGKWEDIFLMDADDRKRSEEIAVMLEKMAAGVRAQAEKGYKP